MITNKTTLITPPQPGAAKLIADKINIPNAATKRLLLVTPFKAVNPPHINNAANTMDSRPSTNPLTIRGRSAVLRSAARSAAIRNQAIAADNQNAASTNAITARM